MAVQWESIPRAQHEALPKRTSVTRDPDWEDILNELQHTDNAVRLPCTDQQQRGTLSRSIGRRAAHRGFKTDIRHGQDERGGFISVRRLERLEERASEPASGASARGGRRPRGADAADATDGKPSAGGT